MRENTRDATRQALFEVFFVVLAVVLPLAANEWRQNRADRERELLERYDETLASLEASAPGEQ
jgi:hypothetical protein